jgi:hypothetical protein
MRSLAPGRDSCVMHLLRFLAVRLTFAALPCPDPISITPFSWLHPTAGPTFDHCFCLQDPACIMIVRCCSAVLTT